MKTILIISLFLFISTNLFASLSKEIIFGYSVENRPLKDVQIGNGSKHIFLVGGIHGGYEWNTVILTRKLIKYFKRYYQLVPANITLHLIDNLNPDGLYKITKTENDFTEEHALNAQAPFLRKGGVAKYEGRFNANDVDLNRNWGYNWTQKALLGSYHVSGGSEAFSEPESKALRNLIASTDAKAVIFYHSAWNEIFAAGAGKKDPHSIKLGYLYGHAADYPVTEYFDSHPLNGDAGDWLSSQGIPSITVELKTHQIIEYDKNNAGVLAILSQISRGNL